MIKRMKLVAAVVVIGAMALASCSSTPSVPTTSPASAPEASTVEESASAPVSNAPTSAPESAVADGPLEDACEYLTLERAQTLLPRAELIDSSRSDWLCTYRDSLDHSEQAQLEILVDTQKSNGVTPEEFIDLMVEMSYGPVDAPTIPYSRAQTSDLGDDAYLITFPEQRDGGAVVIWRRDGDVFLLTSPQPGIDHTDAVTVAKEIDSTL